MPSPEKFKETLHQYNIKQRIIDEINSGYEEIESKSLKKSKRDYFKHAMEVLDSQVPLDIVINLMDDNGCCKSHTARDKASKEFAKIHANKSLEEKLPLIANVKNMGEAKLTEDGKLHILAV